MKRFMACFLALALFAGVFTGCGSKSDSKTAEALEAQTEALFAAVTAFDLDTICTMMGSRGEEAQSVVTTVSEELSPTLLAYMKTNAAGITYTVDEVDTEALTVAVTVNYPDASEVLLSIWAQSVGDGNYGAVDYGDADYQEAVDAVCQQVIAEATEPERVDAQLVLTYAQENDTYVISDVSGDLVNVITSGISGQLSAVTGAGR